MGLYTDPNKVKSFLQGKIRFTADENEQNKFQESFLMILINEAERQVEFDLSERYMAPFQTDNGGPFSTLPEFPTKRLIGTISELLSCIRVLESDFGRAMLSGGDKYAEVQQKRYDKMIEKIVARRKIGGEETLQWKFPPLPSLRLNWHNTEADDGYAGRILVTSDGRGDFPSAQINSPGENFWNGVIDNLDPHGPDGLGGPGGVGL